MSVGVTGPLSAGDHFPVPRSIRGDLLPEEAGDFDREFRESSRARPASVNNGPPDEAAVLLPRLPVS